MKKANDKKSYGNSLILPELDQYFLQKKVLPYIENDICGDLFMEDNMSHSIVMSNGKITSNSHSHSQGFSVRKVTNKKILFFNSSTNLSLDKITEMSKNLEYFPSFKNSLESRLKINNNNYNNEIINKSNLDKKIIMNTNSEKIYEFMKEIYDYIMGKKWIKSSIISYSYGDNNREIFNEKSEFILKNHSTWMLRVNLTLETEVNKQHFYGKSISSQKGFNFLLENWKDLVDFVWKAAYDNILGETIYGGNSTILMGPGEPGVLMHEAIGHAAESDFLSTNTSCLSDKEGTKIATDLVTVIDDGTLEGERGHIAYDDEGTSSQKNILIENGYFVGQLSDKFYSYNSNKKSSGNGRRQSFAHNVLPRMTSTFLLQGKSSTDDLLANVQDGIYAVDFSGGQVNTATGDFVFGASLAYKIKNGKIIHPVSGAMLMGNVLHTLKNISAVGNNHSLCNGSGNCGKNGQTVPVNVGCPSFIIHNITVGGK